MAGVKKTEILGYGVRGFRSRHGEIRKLKRSHNPCYHGHRIWTSSWLLMDFFQHQGLPQGIRVMDVGCGWGMAGIYCAKRHNAKVTCVDRDPEVFPYLHLHARLNGVKLVTLERSFDELTASQFKDIDVLIGADICFWETLVEPLRNLVYRAFQRGVRMVVIADPGRPSFHNLGAHFRERGWAEVMPWAVERPHPIGGRILRIEHP